MGTWSLRAIAQGRLVVEVLESRKAIAEHASDCTLNPKPYNLNPNEAIRTNLKLKPQPRAIKPN